MTDPKLDPEMSDRDEIEILRRVVNDLVKRIIRLEKESAHWRTRLGRTPTEDDMT